MSKLNKNSYRRDTQLVSFPSAMKFKTTSLLALFAVTSFSYGEDLEWFKKRYKLPFKGIQPKESYGNPDAYFKAVAGKLKISEIAVKALSEKLEWKKGDAGYIYPKTNRGVSNFLKDVDGKPLIIWDVSVMRFPDASGKNETDRNKFKVIELYYIELNDDLEVLSLHRMGVDGKVGKSLINLKK